MSSGDEIDEDLFADIPVLRHHPYYHDESQNVAQHYNARPNNSQQSRGRSAIIHLRDFNNWTKSVLIREFVSQRKLKVMDLACGKGGDLLKWDKASVQHVTGVDIAQVSIDHAKERYDNMRPKPSFDAKFLCFDAFNKQIPRGFLPLMSYDSVSCQFAFHYSFSSETSAKTAISNVACALRSGGYFFGIIPDASEIRRRLLDPEQCKDGCSIGNQYYSLKMDIPVTTRQASPFGIRYEFTLLDAVDTCPEYIVPFSTFRRLCEENRMEFVLEAPLPKFYDNFAQVPEYQQLLHRMNIFNDEELAMSSDERDVACTHSFHFILFIYLIFFYYYFVVLALYLAFCFRKK